MGALLNKQLNIRQKNDFVDFLRKFNTKYFFIIEKENIFRAK